MVQLAARAGSPQLVALGFRTYPNFCWERIFSQGQQHKGLALRVLTTLSAFALTTGMHLRVQLILAIRRARLAFARHC